MTGLKVIDESTSAVRGDQADTSFGGGGFRRPGGSTPQYLSRLAEAADLFGRAVKGNGYAMLELKEAFSTSDFPILFADLMSRELLPSYQNAPTIWTSFATRTTVRDFRPHRLIDLIGGQGTLELVPELTEYPARDISEAEYTLLVKKYGARFSLSWESMINDDLGGLQTLPSRLGESARRSEDFFATGTLVTAAGPNPDFFNAANENQLAGNGALTVDSLGDAIDTVTSRVDPDGAPIIISGFVLMVPPSLSTQANKILNATEIRVTDGDTTVITGNYLSAQVTLLVNPWLPVIDQSPDAATTWYLLPVPNGPRPAVAMGFLMGNEAPDLRVKSSDSQRVGGGDIPSSEGGFDIDDIQYRVRHVFGGNHLDPFATMVSLGDNDAP